MSELANGKGWVPMTNRPIHRAVCKAWRSQEVPQEWTDATINKIQYITQERGKFVCGTYGGIALETHAGKVELAAMKLGSYFEAMRLLNRRSAVAMICNPAEPFVYGP